MCKPASSSGHPTPDFFTTGFSDAPLLGEAFDRAALEEWLSLADFYYLRHFKQFSSLEELIGQLLNADFLAMSRAMQDHNRQRLDTAKAMWYDFLSDVFRARS